MSSDVGYLIAIAVVLVLAGFTAGNSSRRSRRLSRQDQKEDWSSFDAYKKRCELGRGRPLTPGEEVKARELFDKVAECDKAEQAATAAWVKGMDEWAAEVDRNRDPNEPLIPTTKEGLREYFAQRQVEWAAAEEEAHRKKWWRFWDRK